MRRREGEKQRSTVKTMTALKSIIYNFSIIWASYISVWEIELGPDQIIITDLRHNKSIISLRNAEGGAQPGPDRAKQQFFFLLRNKMSTFAWPFKGGRGAVHISPISNQSLNLLKFSTKGLMHLRLFYRNCSPAKSLRPRLCFEREH